MGEGSSEEYKWNKIGYGVIIVEVGLWLYRGLLYFFIFVCGWKFFVIKVMYLLYIFLRV